MLAFILPLKPKSQSKDWKKDCALLDATIHSLLNQQNGNYKIYLVFSDEPQLQSISDKVILVKFPFSFYSFSEIPGSKNILPHFNNDKTMLERRWDKSKKIFYGCKVAKEQDCGYLMSVDADDLISNKLVTYIDNQTQGNDIPGFFVDKGFLYYSGKRRMIKINKGMQNFNGSTHILRAEFVTIPDFINGEWMDYNLFTSHGWILSRLKEKYGIELEAIPFPAVVYVAHGGNISKVSQLNFKEKFKHLIKLIIRAQHINATIEKEFAIRL